MYQRKTRNVSDNIPEDLTFKKQIGPVHVVRPPGNSHGE